MKHSNSNRYKRTLSDYALDFKLAVLNLVEKASSPRKKRNIQDRSTVLTYLRKHSRLDWAQPIEYSPMSNSKEIPT